MKYSITLLLVALTVGCSSNIPDIFNTDQPGFIAYHKADESSYKVYNFDLTRYPKLKGQIVGIIKNNQTDWHYYYEGLLGESVPYIVVYVYNGSEQVAGMGIDRDGLIVVRDYKRNFLARHKKDESGAKQLVKLIEETIKDEGVAPSR